MTEQQALRISFSVQDARRQLLYLVTVEVALVTAYVLVHILLSQYRWGPLGHLSDLGGDHSALLVCRGATLRSGDGSISHFAMGA